MKSMLKKLGKKFGSTDDNDNQPTQPTIIHQQHQQSQQQRHNSISSNDNINKSNLKPNNTVQLNTQNNNNANIPSSQQQQQQQPIKTIVRTKSAASSTNQQQSSSTRSRDQDDSNVVHNQQSSHHNDEHENNQYNVNNIRQNVANGQQQAISSSQQQSQLQSNGTATTTTQQSVTTPPPQPQLTKLDLLKPIATLNETPLNARQALIIHKLRLCCILFDWNVIDDNVNSKDNKARESKRMQLLELVEYIGKNKNFYNEAILNEMIHMIEANLFRSLPARQNESVANKNISSSEGDDEDPIFDPSWCHLQIVYELFLRFIVSSDIDMKIMKKWINSTFIIRLLDLFDSEDHRERDYLKTILHRIYAKFMSLRAFIRKAINHVFFIFVYETERHNGISELLEILGSIINGFALPLKNEHKIFLKKVLLPLHSCKNLSTYHQQLAYCVAQFVDKDSTLASSVITHLCKYWPHQTAQKQLLFLNELEELLELCQPEQFKLIATLLAHKLSMAISSPHFQVAERALFLWHNEYVANLIADHRNIILPILYPTLYQNSQPPANKHIADDNNNNNSSSSSISNNSNNNSKDNINNNNNDSNVPVVYGHWNPTVNSLTVNVLKIFAELDQALVDECASKYNQQQQQLYIQQQQHNAMWNKLDNQYKNNNLIKQIEQSIQRNAAALVT